MNNARETIEIKVPIHLDYLFEMAANLTLFKKKQLLGYLQELIQKDEAVRPPKFTNAEFLLTTELGQYIQSNANEKIDIRTVRQELSHIDGSLAKAVNMSREER